MRHVELALVRLGVGDELLQVVRRQILARSPADRLLGDQPDRLEVHVRLVGEVGVERDRGGVRAHVAERERVAVGIGARGAGRAGGAAGAADVLDDELLAERRETVLGDDAGR